MRNPSSLALGFLILIVTSCGNDAAKPNQLCLREGEQPKPGQCYDDQGCPCTQTGSSGTNSGTGGSGNSGASGTTSGSGGTGASSGTGGNGASSGTGGGGLGSPCDYDKECNSGACCAHICVDKSSDEANCGACNNACDTGETCQVSVCQPSGQGGAGGTGNGGSTSGAGGTGNGGSTSGAGGTGNGGSTSGAGGTGNGGSTSGAGGTGNGGSSSGTGGAGGGAGLGDPCVYDADCTVGDCCGGFCVDKDNNESNCGACDNDCNGGTCLSGVCNGGSGGSSGSGGSTSGAGGSTSGAGGSTSGAGGSTSGSGGSSSGSGGGNGGPGDPCVTDNECDTPELSCCSSICVDKDTDEQNCGGCGTVCSSGNVCQNGACLPCLPPTVNCTTFCADFSQDVSCGSCSVQCVGGQHCQSVPGPVNFACQ